MQKPEDDEIIQLSPMALKALEKQKEDEENKKYARPRLTIKVFSYVLAAALIIAAFANAPGLLAAGLFVLGLLAFLNGIYLESFSSNYETSEDAENNILIGSPYTYDGNRHLVTFAPNRSGKFTTVQAPVLLTLNRSMLVIDPKGQAAAVTARRRREMGHKVFMLNPFGLHGLPRDKFNPLASLYPDSNSFVADVGRLVEGLIDQSGNNPHWSNSARDLFTWLIMWTVKHEEEKTLSHVRNLLCLPERSFTTLALDATKSNYSPIVNKAAGFLELTNETKSVVSTAKAETRIFDDPPIQESLSGSDFDFAELKEGKTTVYIILPSDYLSSHAKWLRVLVMSALSAMYRRHDGERVVFMLDEFAQLGYLRDLENAAGLATGYGVQIWPFFQDLNQLQALYGDRWQTFVGNSGIIQGFTPNDLTTAEYFSRLSGGDSNTPPRSNKPMDSILGLSEDQQLIKRSGEAGLWTMEKTVDYYKNPYFAGMYDPDPYHKA